MDDQQPSLWSALLNAQAAFKPILKAAQGQRSKYATLDAVLAAVLPDLHARQLVISQVTEIDGDTLIVRSMLVHTPSGEIHQCVYPAGAIASQHQALGAGVTYARRYSLLGLLGVCPEHEDDDGEKAGAAGARVKSQESGRYINPNSSNQLRKAKAWDSFTDKIQSYVDANDLDGLRIWYTSEDVMQRVAAWPAPWRDAAEDAYDAAFDTLAGKK